MRAGLGRDFTQFVDHMLGRRAVRIAHAEIDNILARAPRRMPHRVHFGDDIRWQALDAVEFVGHSSSFGRWLSHTDYLFTMQVQTPQVQADA